jgi:transcriptional regulator with XRE-family HTH domain
LREAASLSQRGLARRAGVAPETIARLETGARPARALTVRKVAAALGVAPETLLDGDADVLAEPATDDLPPDLRAALARHGVTIDAAGADVLSLEALIEGRGWRYVVEERTPSRPGHRRFHATLFRSDAPSAMLYSARSTGRTELEAVAAALSRMLERDHRRHDRAA